VDRRIAQNRSSTFSKAAMGKKIKYFIQTHRRKKIKRLFKKFRETNPPHTILNQKYVLKPACAVIHPRLSAVGCAPA
jgi:hypothetical protein